MRYPERRMDSTPRRAYSESHDEPEDVVPFFQCSSVFPMKFPSLKRSLILTLGLWLGGVAGCYRSGADEGPCPAGTFGPELSACTPCDAGTYCPEGSLEQTSCEPSLDWDADADPSTACVTVTSCAATEYESAAPDTTSDRPSSTLAACDATEFESTPPTPTSDRVCTLVSPPCTAGTEETSSTSTSDRICTSCVVGATWDDDLNPLTPCVPASPPCGEGTEESAPSTTSNRTCTACAAAISRDHDANPATRCLPYERLSAGGGHTCAADERGRVICWGTNESAESAVPPGLGTVVQVSANWDHTCALNDVGEVTCWGKSQRQQVAGLLVPTELETIVQISTDEFGACALDDEGLLTCWWWPSEGVIEQRVIDGHGPFVQRRRKSLRGEGDRRSGLRVRWI